MRIAVATEGGRVAAHFGRCPEYTLLDVRDGTIERRAVITNPGHQPGLLPVYLAGLGVTCILAGGMGPRARDLFAREGIRAVAGVSGGVDEAVHGYLDGTLQPGESQCEH